MPNWHDDRPGWAIANEGAVAERGMKAHDDNRDDEVYAPWLELIGGLFSFKSQLISLSSRSRKYEYQMRNRWA